MFQVGDILKASGLAPKDYFYRVVEVTGSKMALDEMKLDRSHANTLIYTGRRYTNQDEYDYTLFRSKSETTTRGNHKMTNIFT